MQCMRRHPRVGVVLEQPKCPVEMPDGRLGSDQPDVGLSHPVMNQSFRMSVEAAGLEDLRSTFEDLVEPGLRRQPFQLKLRGRQLAWYREEEGDRFPGPLSEQDESLHRRFRLAGLDAMDRRAGEAGAAQLSKGQLPVVSGLFDRARTQLDADLGSGKAGSGGPAGHATLAARRPGRSWGEIPSCGRG